MNSADIREMEMERHFRDGKDTWFVIMRAVLQMKEHRFIMLVYNNNMIASHTITMQVLRKRGLDSSGSDGKSWIMSG